MAMLSLEFLKMKRFHHLRLLLLGVLITAACAPSAPSQPTLQVPPPPPTADFETPLPPTEAIAPPTLGSTPTAESFTPERPVSAAQSASLPAWRTLPLTNVHTGETFTLADFADKVIYVHPMALWCTTCRAHLRSLRDSVIPQLANPEEVVFVTLAIEPQTTNDALRQYADSESFNWIFAVATQDMVVELITYFGQSVVVPPVTPHFLIRADGRDTGLLTGSPTAQQDLDLINAARST